MNRNLKPQGGVLIIVLVLAALALTLMGVVAARIQNNYYTLVQASSWQSALLATEAGADLAMAELRKTTVPSLTPWVGWSNYDAAGQLLPNNGRRLVVTNLSKAPDCGVEVLVDAPPALVDRSDKQWFRIRSRGYTQLPGKPLVASNVNDRELRKVFFRRDPRNKSQLTRPNTSRYIEVIAKPTSYFAAMIGESLVTMNNQNVTVDSYDSADPAYSTLGLYDALKRKTNGDVATNGKLIEAGGAYIYGDVLTNNGTATGIANISGVERTDFYRELVPVPKPTTWTSINNNPSIIDKNESINSGPKGALRRYKVSTINLSGGESLRISPHNSVPLGANSYIEIWVTGDMKSSGNSEIIVDPGVFVTFYVEGNIDITGNGFVNSSTRAINVQMLGVNPPPGETREVKLAGNAAFIGALYAPGFDVKLSGAGANGTFWGSIVGKTVTMVGTANFHYDEALAIDGAPTDYVVASWYEDNN